MAILIWILLVVLGATTEIASRASFTIPAFARINTNLFHAIGVDDLLLDHHVALLESLHHNDRQMRLVVFIRELARSCKRTHMTGSKLLLTRMTEFDERAVLKLLKVAWAHKQLPAVCALA